MLPGRRTRPLHSQPSRQSLGLVMLNAVVQGPVLDAGEYVTDFQPVSCVVVTRRCFDFSTGRKTKKRATDMPKWTPT